MNSKMIWSTVDETEYRATDVEGVGNYRTIGDKIFKWVLNGTGVAIVAGSAYYFGTSDLTLRTIYTLGQSTKGTAIDLQAGYGVSAIPIGYYGWIQVHGAHATLQVEGTSAVSVGDNLKGVSGQVYVVKDTAAGTAPTNRRGAIALAAQAAGAVVSTAGFINCLN